MRKFGVRRLLAAATGAAIALGTVLVGAPAAQAATTVTIGAGTAFGQGTVFYNGSVATDDRCTIAAVGRDTDGRLLALTAAHCFRETVAPNNIITDLYVQNVKVGTSIGRHFTGVVDGPQILPGYYDFNFFVLDESKVTVSSERGADVSGGIPAPDFHPGTFTKVCISGMTTGKKCGSYIGDGGTDPRDHIIGFQVLKGDSGGPLYTTDGKLLGIGSAGGGVSPAAYYADVRDSISYAQSQGWIGGFAPLA